MTNTWKNCVIGMIIYFLLLIAALFLSTSNSCGYTYTDEFKGYGFDSLIQFGAWRTEEEIKQVVAALRGGIKA